MKRTHPERILAALAISLCWVVLAEPAHATDGVLEINQTCAVQTGCFVGDSPGFPVTLNGVAGRSFRLTSDLLVPGVNTDAITVLSSDLSIDLNNFTIIRNGCQGSTTSCRVTSGTGSGVLAPNDTYRGTTLKNGSIVGMAMHGVYLGPQAIVTNIRVRWSGLFGVRAASGCHIGGVIAHENFAGIVADEACVIHGNAVHGNEQLGLRGGGGSTISGNASYDNGSSGIVVSAYSMARGNTSRNQNFGFSVNALAAYYGNVATANPGANITPFGGRNAGNNACGTGLCP